MYHYDTTKPVERMSLPTEPREKMTKEIIATGHEAIELKESDDSVKLNKYNDPIEEAREDISADEAREIAKEDPSLIYATK